MATMQTRTMVLGQTRQALFCLSMPVTPARIQPFTRASSSSSKTHSRPSSSAQPLTKATVPSTSSTASTSLDAINPPPSTHPADLLTPDPVSADATTTDKLKRYVALGRAYLSFYKTGLKNVYHNYRAALPLRRELGVIPIYLPTSPPPKAGAKADEAFRTALHRSQLTRSNFQLIRRAAFDVRRMVPFSLMLVICGELTPLVVLAAGSAVVPMTCRVPAQFAKDRAKHVSRKRAALVAHSVQDSGSVSQVVQGEAELALLATRYASPEWVERCSGEEVLRACAVFGLVGTHVRPMALVGLVYRKRLQRFVEYLAIDDELVCRAGGVGAMQAVEVRRAVEERGGVELVHGIEDGWDAEREQRRWLDAWLERRKDILG